MKQKLLFLLGITALFHLSSNAQFNVTELENGAVQHSEIGAVDIDNDGDIDLIVSGEDGADRKSNVYLNDGSGNFTLSTSPFPAVTRPTIDFDDINNDGNVDVIISGFPAIGPPVDSIFTSDGQGNFTNANIAIPQMAPGSGMADLNNDGYTDIYVFGNKFEGHAKIFFNDGNGGFTESAQFEAYNFIDPDVTEVDYDNDGDIDLFVNAGFEDGVGTRFSKMFENNNGNFSEKDLGLIPKGYGSAVWGDYNGDGFLDLLLNGDGYLGSGEDNDGVYRLYRNINGVFDIATTFEFYRQNSTGDGARFADWDNDGDLDVIVTGWNGSRQATDIYLSAGGVFTPYSGNENIPGVSEGSIEVADVDNDRDLDILITGYSGNEYNGGGSAFNRNVALVVENPATNANIPPLAPTDLRVTGNQSAVTFRWDAPTDGTTPEASLSYNLYVVNDQGQTFLFPNADTASGRMLVQRLGNVQLNTRWTLKNLPAGNYCWGVQAVDNSFDGSSFAKSCFSINADGTLPVVLSSFTAKAEGSRARIEWVTASEQNSDHFEVKRSVDGRNFSLLQSVKAKGTTSEQSKYVIYDSKPVNGTNYYSLTYFDRDGKVTSYGIVTVSFKNGNVVIKAYPNPTVKDLGFTLSNYEGKQVSVALMDINGRLVHKEVFQTLAGEQYYKLHLNGKPQKGTYFLMITGDDLKETQKVIVE